MNRAHQVLECLSSGNLLLRVGDSESVEAVLSSKQSDASRGAKEALIYAIRESEKFDFDDVVETFDKNLYETAWDLVRADRLVVPYDMVWADLGADGPLEDQVFMGALAVNDARDGAPRGFMLFPFFKRKGEAWSETGYHARINSSECRDNNFMLRRNAWVSPHVRLDKNAARCSAIIAQWFIEAMTCLSATGVNIRREDAPARLNVARAKKNLVPLFDHNVVRIGPGRAGSRRRSGGAGEPSMREHWRRGHLRSRPFTDDKSIIVRPHLVGSADFGTVSHDYKIV